MKHSINRLLLACVFSLACFWPLTANARVYIDITSAQTRKVPIAIPYLEEEAQPGVLLESGKKMADLLGRALDFHGFIGVIPSEKYGGGMQADWASIGADFVVKGQFSRSANGMEVDLKLVEVQSGKMLMGRRYRGTWEKRRFMLLKFCDEVILELSGEQGVSLSQIAFTSDTTGHKEIYLADVLGDELRQVTSHGSIAVSPRFSPDGSRLAYTSYHRGSPDLYITDLSQNRTTKPVSRRKGLNMAPGWSPDGKMLALTLSVDGNPDLFLMDLNGQIQARLTKDAGINVSPSWSPDGKQICFVSDRTGDPQVYIMDVASRAVRRLTYQGNYNTSPTWSPKGDLIVYCGRDSGSNHIFTISVDGNQIKRLTDSWGDYESPSWAPDGRQVVFTRKRGDAVQVCAVFYNGTGLRPLFKFSGRQTFPQWSPRLQK